MKFTQGQMVRYFVSLAKESHKESRKRKDDMRDRYYWFGLSRAYMSAARCIKHELYIPDTQ